MQNRAPSANGTKTAGTTIKCKTLPGLPKGGPFFVCGRLRSLAVACEISQQKLKLKQKMKLKLKLKVKG